MWSAARSAKISMILCMPERVSAGDAKFQGFCDGWKNGRDRLRSRIHRKGRRNKPLSEREKQGNKTRSSVRVRVEHVFGAQSNDMGGTLVRSVGLVRAKARIGLKNLAYNMRRLVQLERLAAAV